MITIQHKNHVYLKVQCEPSIAQEISDHFTFDVPGAKFNPLFRNKMWDGKIRLYSMMTKELYTGLLSYLEHFCEVNNYTIDYSQYVSTSDSITIEILKEFVDSLQLSLPNNETIRDYQLDAIFRAINDGRRLLLSPTGSGKSLIIYCLLRWNETFGRKQLILVPTTSLCMQMRSDFESYSKNNGWKCDEMVDIIMAGYTKTPVKTRIKITYEDGSEEFFQPSEILNTTSGQKVAKDLSSNDTIL